MASSQEIAVAYISLVPSLSGVQGNIAKEFAGITSAAEQVSKKVSGSLTSGFKSAANAASLVAKSTAKAASEMSRGFKTGAVDGFAASLGALGKTGVTSLVALTRALPGVSAGFEKVRGLALAGPRMFSQFAAGFKSPTAAASMFTGVMGTLGGKARGALDGVITKTASLGRSIAAPAKNFMDGFRAMNGGVMEFSGRMGNLGAIVGNSLKPVVDVGRSVGNVVKNIGGAIGPAMGSALGAIGNFASQSVRVIGQIAGKIADTFRGPATAAVVTGVAAMGVALTKGLGRLNAIDTAKAKLRGLGNDADSTAAIMKNATAAVKGTAYGLDAAAQTAAGAVAAGIKPGQQLESTLKTVANVAAATGRGMDDMGQVFNQVAAGGKAYTEQIKQVAYAGLPIWEKLSDVLGVTTDEVQKMASSGQIDFETFQKAASLAAGTVAEEMGKTLPGSLDNLGAAISRTGANLWKGLELDDGSYTGIYSKLTNLVQAITNALGPVEDIASKVGNAVGEKLGPAFDFVTGKLNAFADGSDNLKSKFGPLMSAIAPAGAAFGMLGVKGLAPLLTKLPLVGGMLGPLPKMLGAIGGPAGIAAAGLLTLAKVDPTQMAAGFQSIASQLPSMIDGIIGVVANLAGEIIPSLLQGLTANVPILLDGITGMISTILQALVGALPMLMDAAVTLFMGLVQALVEIVPPLLESVLALIPMVIGALVEMLPALVEGAITLFMGIVQALTDIVPPLLETVLGLLPQILESLIGMLPALVEGAITLFMGIVTALPEIIPPLIDAVIGLIPVIVESLLSMIDALLEGAITLFTALVDALPEVIPALIQAVADLGPQLVQAVIDLVPQLFQAGKDLLGGLIDGIKDMAGGAVEAIKGVGSSMLSGIKGFFGIASPSKVMADIGGYLDSGLAGGLGKGASSVAAMTATSKQITAVTDNLKRSVMGTAQAVGQQVNAIIASLQRLVSMMSGAFRNGVTTQLTQVALLFQTVVPNAAKLMQSQTQNSLRGLQTWVGGAFKSTLVTAVNAIKTAFVAVPGAVSSSWSRIKSGTAAPSNYVISTVYMNGIRSAVNAIAKAVGVSANMPAVKSIGYASGGVLPGYTPGRDIYDFYNPQVGTLRLSGGEGILRPEVVKALGAGTIDAWNSSRGRGVYAYAGGGILDFLKKGSNGWSVDTGGGFLGSIYGDPSGGMKALVADPAKEYAGRAGGGSFGAAMGGSMVNLAGKIAVAMASKIKAAMPDEADLGATGFSASGPVMGYRAMVAILRKAFPGIAITSTYRPGAITATGYKSLHGMGRAVDMTPSMQIFNWIKKNFPNSTEIIYSPAGAGQVYKGRPYFYPEPTRSMHFNHVHWGLREGGIVPRLYDEGGYLPPGLSLVENRTGKPEPVFTSDQVESLRGVRDVYFQIDVSQLRDLTEAADLLGSLDRRIRMGVA